MKLHAIDLNLIFNKQLKVAYCKLKALVLATQNKSGCFRRMNKIK